MIDEAHHSLADNSYGTIIRTLKAKNRSLKVVGFTATPKRTDKKALKSVFDEICYSWLIPDGINGGFLVPTTRVRVETKVNLSTIKTVSGDYAQNTLVSVLKTSNWLALSIDAYKEHVATSHRQCLAFLPSVDMSKEFARGLQEAGINAAHVDGETDKAERQSILRDYIAGKIQCVSNMAVLTEGFDAPCTSAIFLARPTRSQTLFTQIVGRGLRPFPAKSDCILLDMAVLDTKALEVGTLLGKTIQCKQCKAEYYAGFECCPRCGAVPAKELPSAKRKNGELLFPFSSGNEQLGEGLISHYESVFEKAFNAWHIGQDGYMSCSMGFGNGALVVMPPVMDNQYRLALVPQDKAMPIKMVGMNEDLKTLIEYGEMYLRENTTEREQKTISKQSEWRAKPASDAQRGLLHQLGMIETPESMSMGTAGQIITHLLHVKRAINEAWSV